MICPNCKESIPSDAVFCFNCGVKIEEEITTENGKNDFQTPESELEPQLEPEPEPQSEPKIEPEWQPNHKSTKDQFSKKSKSGGFFSFDKMITLRLIKFIFILGLIPVVLLGLFTMGAALEADFGNGLLLIIGVVIIFIGSILWRVICELLIVIFKIHESLEDIRRQL